MLWRCRLARFALRLTSDQLAPRFEAYSLVGCLAVQHALAPVVVGGVGVAQELLEVYSSVEDRLGIRA